ncbi:MULTISPECIES: TraR/DksA family transcriptional regulator [unclassified Streptomyces]|uniref:TraR/DksA family transcriptional regulator n=1 Tax=unclassified Streptomyces TaxID=2593676 RepID=UPI002E80BC2D|nr:TraR/DksA family transcriptional regulator [Streptomyces sp. NBC_00589]WTI39921.1 TraR/DksA family transcriptional regulator [Streptomyces sp. NBC_00775]WUB26399.1 TraR/DksA family transcriptional regulator [Streptomyces sp. NBC_00589]
MVAKKTAVQQSASGRSTGPAAKDVGGKKTTQGAPATDAVKPVKTASRTATKAVTKAATKKTATTKTATKKAATTKTATTKTATTKAETAKSASTETAARKAASTKAAASKTASTETAASKAAAKKATVKKTAAAATKAVAKKAAGKKTAAKKSTSTAKKAVASAAEGAAQAAKTTGATTVVAKKTPGTATAAKKPTPLPKARLAAAEPGELAVRPGEDPWTPEEVAEARAELQSEALRLSTEISSSEEALVGLMRDSGDGAGDDQADTGTKNITREHEMALAANAREMLEQTERALERLDAGTYGLCENCGNPIGKARMQAFPRATLCVECKQKQERRY